MPKDDVFSVERIVKMRMRKGKREYLVKWVGWPDSANTWEPTKNILDPTLFDIFHEEQQEGKKRDSSGSGRKRRSTKDGSDDEEDEPVLTTPRHLEPPAVAAKILLSDAPTSSRSPEKTPTILPKPTPTGNGAPKLVLLPQTTAAGAPIKLQVTQEQAKLLKPVQLPAHFDFKTLQAAPSTAGPDQLQPKMLILGGQAQAVQPHEAKPLILGAQTSVVQAQEVKPLILGRTQAAEPVNLSNSSNLTPPVVKQEPKSPNVPRQEDLAVQSDHVTVKEEPQSPNLQRAAAPQGQDVQKPGPIYEFPEEGPLEIAEEPEKTETAPLATIKTEMSDSESMHTPAGDVTKSPTTPSSPIKPPPQIRFLKKPASSVFKDLPQKPLPSTGSSKCGASTSTSTSSPLGTEEGRRPSFTQMLAENTAELHKPAPKKKKKPSTAKPKSPTKKEEAQLDIFESQPRWPEQWAHQPRAKLSEHELANKEQKMFILDGPKKRKAEGEKGPAGVPMFQIGESLTGHMMDALREGASVGKVFVAESIEAMKAKNVEPTQAHLVISVQKRSKQQDVEDFYQQLRQTAENGMDWRAIDLADPLAPPGVITREYIREDGQSHRLYDYSYV
ncbi:unnamed protein product, partial [Mesorhabditis spiculigera]